MNILPKIYPITDTRITKLSHLEQCKRLINGGANFVQLREKCALSDEFYEATKSVLEFAQKQNVNILINDRVDIALTTKADGVHLGQDDFPPEKARKLLGKDAIIGYSTHNIEQAKLALTLPIDYIAIGPIFATNTKENTYETLGINMLKEIRKAVGNFPLVAIGGINLENYKQVLEAGANSVAMISSILKDTQNISNNFKNLIQ